MTDLLNLRQHALLKPTLTLAADAIREAARYGDGRWGVSHGEDRLRVNVGWTEIFTATPEDIRLVVTPDKTGLVGLPSGVTVERGRDRRGFYPSVPGSVLATITYSTPARIRRVAARLRPALFEAIRLAARRRAGHGVRAGHNPWAVDRLATALGCKLPTPGFAKEQLGHRVVSRSTDLVEGALRRMMASRFERSAAARARCIEYYGAECSACGLSFERMYGSRGRGFIHVHHVTPLATTRRRDQVDPMKDLRPVCPNCHAMLHRDAQPLSIAKLQSILRRSGFRPGQV